MCCRRRCRPRPLRVPVRETFCSACNPDRGVEAVFYPAPQPRQNPCLACG